jgi:hypothetical protein
MHQLILLYRDQELRFTVHESPDYYKLKCSVFNDDKKTDLIGEAWIDLSAVVIPGGGQSDMWHQLQFKGKYAGDVRMELTYYDTRPKDETVVEKRREKERVRQEQANDTSNDVAGPRRFGPREVKRRPLPTDPLKPSGEVRPSLPEQSHSAPLPQLHPQEQPYNPQQKPFSNPWAPDAYHHSLPASQYSQHGDGVSSDEPFDHEFSTISNDYQQYPLSLPPVSTQYTCPNYDRLLGAGTDVYDLPFVRPVFPATPAQSLHQTPPHNEHHPYPTPSPPIQSGSSPHSAPLPYGSSPPFLDQNQRTRESVEPQGSVSFRGYSTSPTKNDVFRDSPLRQSISQHEIDPGFEEQYDVSEDEGPPPPPPAHRNPMQTSVSLPNIDDSMLPVQVPRPLNLSATSRRMSPFDRSPLQSIERNFGPGYQNSQPTHPVPAETEDPPIAYSKPVYTPVNHRPGGGSKDRPISGVENTPPSLRSGYSRSMEETEDPIRHDDQHMYSESMINADSPRNRVINRLDRVPVRYERPHVEDDPQMHISGTPIVKPQARTPDSRSVPRRKAVSPQPFPAPDEKRMSAVPFGPDSYDVFNPSSPLSSSVAGPESRYETPEQAKEAARQHEVEKLRDVGPIIGNDGRVIDPSDHLPTDTWAPEPVRKNRKPEMVIRYKTKEPAQRMPNGYGSSPGSARPHSIAGSVYGSSPIASDSPSGMGQQKHGRNRLQKQMPGRPLPTQPYQQSHSSPAVPMANHNTPSPRSNFPPRPDLSEYPLYGQQNHRNSYGGSSRGMPVVPPPVPGKIPISPISPTNGHGGYGGMDALSAELSTIDIGSGGSSRGGRRTRRGYGF